MTDIPDRVLRARQMYLDGVKVNDILAATGLSLRAFYQWRDGGPHRAGAEPPLAPLPTRRLNFRRVSRKGDRLSIVTRIWRAAELQVRDIEQRLSTDQQKDTDRERDMRTLAVAARTMRDLKAFEDSLHHRTAKTEDPADDDDARPRDLDELRRTLAEKLERIVAGQSSEGPGAA
jgi:hypothetical protein